MKEGLRVDTEQLLPKSQQWAVCLNRLVSRPWPSPPAPNLPDGPLRISKTPLSLKDPSGGCSNWRYSHGLRFLWQVSKYHWWIYEPFHIRIFSLQQETESDRKPSPTRDSYSTCSTSAGTGQLVPDRQWNQSHHEWKSTKEINKKTHWEK